ncbi:hypothetical protein L9F63_022349, partial [Diploptera punctata]
MTLAVKARRSYRVKKLKATSELVALMAISTTLFLFIHTRDLHTRIKEMEVKLQPEDMLSSNQISGHKPSEIHRDMRGVYGDDCMDHVEGILKLHARHLRCIVQASLARVTAFTIPRRFAKDCSLAKRRGTTSLTTTAYSPKIFFKIIIAIPA